MIYMTFLGGALGPFIQEKPQEEGPKHPLQKSYRSYFRRAQIRWVIWRSSNLGAFKIAIFNDTQKGIKTDGFPNRKFWGLSKLAMLVHQEFWYTFGWFLGTQKGDQNRWFSKWQVLEIFETRDFGALTRFRGAAKRGRQKKSDHLFHFRSLFGHFFWRFCHFFRDGFAGGAVRIAAARVWLSILTTPTKVLTEEYLVWGSDMYIQTTQEGRGCFRGLFGGSPKRTPGKWRGNCWNVLSESRNALNPGFGAPWRANLLRTLGWHCPHLVATFCGGCFLKSTATAFLSFSDICNSMSCLEGHICCGSPPLHNIAIWVCD